MASTALTSSRPARTARSASSSWVVGHAPHRHHGVADELLHGAAVAGDDLPALLEVRREQLAHVLLVAGLGQAREPDEVAEQDAGDAARHLRSGGGDGRGCRGGWTRLGGPALQAEPGSRPAAGRRS